jgi:esterase/lipase superfamily enzyme
MSEESRLDESQLLAEAVARAWPDPPPAEVSCLNAELLRFLRELDSAAPAQGEPVRVEILSLLKPVPALARQVDEQIELLRSAVRSTGPATDVAGQVKHYRHSLVELVYATDRRPTDQSDPRHWFGSDRGELSLGLAAVQIPDDHRMCRLDRPRPWPLRFGREVRQHLKLTRLAPDEAGDLTCVLPGLARRAPEPEVLVFIHGYNVSFEAAARRAAQIAYDLDFKGVPMLYSWPSAASGLDYVADGVAAEWSQPHFTAFLRHVLNTPEVRRVHVIAHSMGNRVLTEALVMLATTPPAANSAQLGQIVFAAPDVDADVFTQHAKQFAGRAERYTLYASDKDRALNLSQRFAGYPRAGQAGAGIVVVEGVDTIDATELDTGLMSHSYIGNHRSILSDLYYLIQRGEVPDNRFGLQPVVARAGVYWAFRP